MNTVLSREEALFNREKARECRLRSWVRDNCRSFQTIDVNIVPVNLRVKGFENVVLDECKKINASLGSDLSDDP